MVKSMLKKISEWLKPAAAIKSGRLILIATLYFGLIMNMSLWRFILTHIQITDPRTGLFVLSLVFFILIPLYLIFCLTVVPYIAKPALIILLLISASTNCLMFHYGVLIDVEMIRNTFETNMREAMDFFSCTWLAWMLLTGILPALWIGFVKIEYAPLKTEIKNRSIGILSSLAVIGLFAAVFYKEYASFLRNKRDIRKLINTSNYTYYTFRYFQRKAEANRTFVILDENAFARPSDKKGPSVFVFVLGEAARAKNFSLYGYERETNPNLKKQDIIRFADVTSCGTSTAVSVPCMFSHLERSEFDVDDARYMENLLDILQKSGIDILWLENDDGCKGVCLRAPTESMVAANNPKYCNGKYCIDEVLIDGLKDRIKNIKNDTMIILHTMGSHGPSYFARYPEKFKAFNPACNTSEIQRCTKESVVNTYDNTILYTDYIISSVINTLKQFPQMNTSMLYVSDHGESLGENNIYLHGFPYKISPVEQRQIPMLLWMSEKMKKEDRIDEKCMREQAAAIPRTHDNFFHSVLSLFNIETKLYREKYDMFKGCRIPPEIQTASVKKP